MRYKDNPELGTKSSDEILDELHGVALDLRNAIKRDDKPPRIRLSDGTYVEGEVAEMWLRFQEGIISILDTAVYHLERDK